MAENEFKVGDIILTNTPKRKMKIVEIEQETAYLCSLVIDKDDSGDYLQWLNEDDIFGLVEDTD
jgi:hypothetical protein